MSSIFLVMVRSGVAKILKSTARITVIMATTIIVMTARFPKTKFLREADFEVARREDFTRARPLWMFLLYAMTLSYHKNITYGNIII